MKRFFQILLTVVFFLPTNASSLDIVPGLKGYGTDTRAAYGNSKNPTIFVVNTLTPDTALSNSTRNGVAVKQGGLKSAIDYGAGDSDYDNKLIIFEVGGTIVNYGSMRIKNNYVTIAGQTAPSPGISLQGTSLHISSGGYHDILIQHIRIRTGDDASGIAYDNRSSIESYGSNVVLDHCSFAWSTDTTVEVDALYGAISNVTVSNSIISEGLNGSYHSKGNHSTGMLLGYGSSNISILYNLFAHNDFRNPAINSSSSQDKILLANNIVYNPGYRNMQWDEDSNANNDEYITEGNIVTGGPSTYGGADAHIDTIKEQDNGNDFYFDENRFEDYEASTYNQTDPDDWTYIEASADDKANCKVTSRPFSLPSGYTPIALDSLVAYVLANVGARPDDRDVVDARIIAEWQAKTGSVIDYIVAQNPAADCYPNCVRNNEAGWPNIGTGSVSFDATFPATPYADDDSDGYTNLEEWLHEFSAQVEGSSTKTTISPPVGLTIH